MTLTTGKLSTCIDKNIQGGLEFFWLANCVDHEAEVFTLGVAGTAEDYISTIPGAAVWYKFDPMELRSGVTSSSEGLGKGLKGSYEMTFFMPGHLTDTLLSGREIQNAGRLLLISKSWDGDQRLFGYDEKLGFSAAGQVSSIVDATGADLIEQEVKGLEITLTFIHGEIPRIASFAP